MLALFFILFKCRSTFPHNLNQKPYILLYSPAEQKFSLFLLSFYDNKSFLVPNYFNIVFYTKSVGFSFWGRKGGIPNLIYLFDCPKNLFYFVQFVYYLLKNLYWKIQFYVFVIRIRDSRLNLWILIFFISVSCGFGRVFH